MSEVRKLLLIGLDAGDPVLIERWIADGTLPYLGELKKHGVHGRLTTSAEYLAGSIWPTFYTGQPPSCHGIYHDFQWRHKSLDFARPAADWLTVEPFWRGLPSTIQAVVYDVPMIMGCTRFPGVEVSSWAGHDRLASPASHPPELLQEIREELGEWSIKPEGFGPSGLADLLELREQLLENTRRSTDLICRLLDRPWNLAIAILSALHRGGHRLWDRSSVKSEIQDEERGLQFDRALRDLYVACDESVRRIVQSTDASLVIVFSLHGMMANTSRVDLLEDMLDAVLGHRRSAPLRVGLMRRLGESMPIELRRFLTRQIPVQLRNRLVTHWTTGGIDWSHTEAFALRADLQGYIRINLKGREPQGIVAPGQPYDRLCNQISEGLQTFRDALTGEALVEAVHRSDQIFPSGPRLDHLPDLIVCWKQTPAAKLEVAESPLFGKVLRRTPGRIPNGRSGNHRPQGYFLAAGSALSRQAGEPLQADILDLPATVLRFLGVEPNEPLAGRPIAEVIGSV